MAEKNEPEQLVLMRQMVEMAAERNRMASERTAMASERTRMADERTVMASERTTMAADRSEMSAERSYMAAERTLSVWVRTALSLMVFGIAIDRFGLLLRKAPLPGTDQRLDPEAVSVWGGAGLVAFGVVMVLTTGVRFWLYVIQYRRHHQPPDRHGPFLAPVFAFLVAIFGIGLLMLMMLAFTR